uniref:Putative secreted protein n=1 Tax=Anopheles darlingi TaxID=43151 RepID=A0A2M4DFX0_ANODA
MAPWHSIWSKRLLAFRWLVGRNRPKDLLEIVSVNKTKTYKMIPYTPCRQHLSQCFLCTVLVFWSPCEPIRLIRLTHSSHGRMDLPRLLLSTLLTSTAQ